jgi:CDP-6-deoxy-D-xylo-4-hexulose-3-dehydrase
MIPLMKNAFLNEFETKKALADFIIQAPKLSMDLKCLEFEKAFAVYQGTKHALLFNSGASANLAILQALLNLGRLKKNDKVGFSAVTWSTNTMPIIQLGLSAIPVDCSPNTLNSMSTDLLKMLEVEDLKAFFITNALGFSGDLVEIKKICAERNIILIEDNCEALGSELDGNKTGNFGVASSFSFFVAHHMSTIEGGMVCTFDDELAEMLIIVRANGWDRNLTAKQQHKWRSEFNIPSEFEAKYTFYDLAFNLRPTEITGFLGLYQLQFLKDNVIKREQNYSVLEAVAMQNEDILVLDRKHISVLSSFAIPIICKTPAIRDRYVGEFAGAGIEIRPMIAGNMQKQPFYKKYIKKQYALPGADFIHECGFYCGNYPELTKMDIETISSCLIKK